MINKIHNKLHLIIQILMRNILPILSMRMAPLPITVWLIRIVPVGSQDKWRRGDNSLMWELGMERRRSLSNQLVGVSTLITVLVTLINLRLFLGHRAAKKRRANQELIKTPLTTWDLILQLLKSQRERGRKRSQETRATILTQSQTALVKLLWGEIRTQTSFKMLKLLKISFCRMIRNFQSIWTQICWRPLLTPIWWKKEWLLLWHKWWVTALPKTTFS